MKSSLQLNRKIKKKKKNPYVYANCAALIKFYIVLSNRFETVTPIQLLNLF